jgi:FrmR/RcnR family transcriptional regulator, repressor of rcnA expression
MAHTTKSRDKLIARIKRLQGQLGSVSEALEREEDCYKVLQTLASARGALQGLMGEIVEGHIREHVVGAVNAKEAHEAGEQTIEIMKSFWK